ncbi:TPA: flagellar hook-basal body protein [Candidatus Poribacteria bacterium]|nr:flagellar hook-basal body protein [Candidatus Poribacteria bacterium]HIA69640.1 flagellar hook-basal body protein [Candidatus Poribacteria bacterium]HIB85816.1 flagellar hook-basal body protein [Candidatus Poribacteria bacterium]HIC00011.1 flagellar hook-basal body protein [Candidatus Poribacteria bacterium]HIM12879.1 flagellar hook-basal body protein [Candidatus Poribacteria bacterium]
MQGIYKAAQGMIYETMRIDIIANNLANVNANGYKGSALQVTSTFDAELTQVLEEKMNIKPPSNVSQSSELLVARYNIDFQQGPLKETNEVYDVAIAGRGFFGIQNVDGSTVFTRDGSFTTNDQGQLVNGQGLFVLDQSGQPVQIPSGASELTISTDGRMFADDVGFSQLMLIDFEQNDPYPLGKIGGNLFEITDSQAQPISLNATRGVSIVKQGFLELANVNVVHEMVNMIQTLRNFQGYQKIIQALDETVQLINNVAKQ